MPTIEEMNLQLKEFFEKPIDLFNWLIVMMLLENGYEEDEEWIERFALTGYYLFYFDT